MSNLRDANYLEKIVKNKVDKVDGKQLSTEDFTTEFKDKLVSLENYDDTQVNEEIQNTKDLIPTKTSQLTNDSSFATETFVTEKISQASLGGSGVDTSGFALKSELHEHANKDVIDTITQDKINGWDAKSDFSGSYNDLTDKPTIPTTPLTHIIDGKAVGSLISSIDTKEDATYSIAIGGVALGTGNKITNTAYYSGAFGSNNNITGRNSFASGDGNTVNGSYSHAEGSSNKTGDYYSHAEGSNCEATGSASHAEGMGTKASGYQAHSEGSGTKATGDYSHAEGSNSEAIGQMSHAEGGTCKSVGSYSHAGGQTSVANGVGSFAHGHGTVASSQYQTTLGKFNVEDTSNLYALLIGNGEENSRANILALDWDGNLHIAGDLTDLSGNSLIPIVPQEPTMTKTDFAIDTIFYDSTGATELVKITTSGYHANYKYFNEVYMEIAPIELKPEGINLGIQSKNEFKQVIAALDTDGNIVHFIAYTRRESRESGANWVMLDSLATLDTTKTYILGFNFM